MIELRVYQRELMGRAESALAPDKARVMMQLPTGGGKTIIAAHLLDNLIRNRRKAVWLTHRKELAEQTCRMLTTAHIQAIADVRWDPGTCPFHKLELREISELPATRMLGSSSCRTFRGSASALLRGIGVSWREVP